MVNVRGSSALPPLVAGLRTRTSRDLRSIVTMLCGEERERSQSVSERLAFSPLSSPSLSVSCPADVWFPFLVSVLLSGRHRMTTLMFSDSGSAEAAPFELFDMALAAGR